MDNPNSFICGLFLVAAADASSHRESKVLQAQVHHSVEPLGSDNGIGRSSTLVLAPRGRWRATTDLEGPVLVAGGILSLFYGFPFQVLVGLYSM